MKPKQLLTSCVKEGVFVVPRAHEVLEREPLPRMEEIFGNCNPVHIEFCSGNGEWIAENAAQNKGINWIGVEKQFARVRKIWSKKKNQQLENLFIVYGMAEDFLEHYFINSFVEQIYINFPDPWPKTRHAKHRIMQQRFVEALRKISQEGALLTIVTDELPYAEEIVKELQKSAAWESAFPPPNYIKMPTHYGTSYFQRLFVAQQKKIWTIQFVRKGG